MARKPKQHRAAFGRRAEAAEAPDPAAKAVAPDGMRRRRGMEPATSPMHQGVARLLGKRGFAEARIVTRWATIVGDELARVTCPEKLARRGTNPATLTIRAGGAAALAVQHRIPMIIDRINGFFGFEAVGRITLVQGPVAVWRGRQPLPPPPPLPPERRARLVEQTGSVHDPALRDALLRLGTAVAQRQLSTMNR